MAMSTEEKIETICSQAEWYYIRAGYHNTQISNIAKSAGVAVGSIYTIFTGKKALFQYVLLRVFHIQHKIMGGKGLPIEEISQDVFMKEIRTCIDEVIKFGLTEPSVLPSFEEFIASVFDMMDAYGPAFLIFERNQMDFEKMCSIYAERRLEFIKYFQECIVEFQKRGEVRELDDLYYHARLMIETISWWGMHVRYDIRDIVVSQDISRRVVIDALLHAYRK